MSFFEQIKQKFLKLNLAQQISIGVLVICIPLVLALSVNAINKSAAAMALLDQQSSSEEISSEEVIIPSSIEEEISSEEEESSSEEDEEKEPITITLKPSSIEEDLEVQIVDEQGNMVTGYPFILTVVAKDGSYNKQWTVDDGFLRLTKISAGEYIVTIDDAEGYIIPVKTIECTVEKKVEYEEIDVSDLVVDESEIDVKKEDAALSKPVEVPVITPKPVTYADQDATETVTYKYIVKISSGDFKEENTGYILDTNGNKTKYVAKVDKDSYLVGDIRLAPEVSANPTATATAAAAAAEVSATDVSMFLGQAVSDSQLLKTYYKNSYKIVPLTLRDYDILQVENPATTEAPVVTEKPTEAPVETEKPTEAPVETEKPTEAPIETEKPTEAPVETEKPTEAPVETEKPTEAPVETEKPTEKPVETEKPTEKPVETEKPTEKPVETEKPTDKPVETEKPSGSTSPQATTSPSASPQTPTPTATPTPTPKPSFDSLKKATDAFDGTSGKLKADFIKGKDITDKSTTTYKNGWKDGKYYTADGTMLKGTQAAIGNGTFNFDKDGNIIKNIASGIDVSKWQGNIDWKAVKASGVDYAIIRVGYRGYGSGALVEDPYFRQNIAGARAAGLKVGVYFFSQAITTAEAVEEASMAINAVKDYKLHYPIYFDTEAATSNGSGRADPLSSAQRTDIAKAFCQTVQNSGYRAGVYASKAWFLSRINYSALSSYDIWLAHYTSATDFAHRYDMWQYTGSGRVNGVSGAVDMNWAYKVY
ncbi:MAG: hypothetical protein IJW74_01970 [Oscillospiraceae bacterium]|nr:hypothetical protein [Oscillospiraceae bacterium]